MKKRYDIIEEVNKFNPFHDGAGKFSNKNGFASYSANPNTRAGAMAIARSAAAGHGSTMNVHRESKGETIRRNANWLGKPHVGGNGQGSKHLRNITEPATGTTGASRVGANWQRRNQQAGRTTTGGKKPAPATKPQATAKPQQQTAAKPQNTAKPSANQNQTAAKPQNQTAAQGKTITVKQKMKSGVTMDSQFNQSTIAGAKNKEFRGTAEGKDITKKFDATKMKTNDLYMGRDRFSNHAADMQGFNSPAKKVSKAEFDKLAKQNGDVFYRTVGSGNLNGKRKTAKGMKDSYTKENDMGMNGPSGRVYGDGIYTTSSKMQAGRGRSVTNNDMANAKSESRYYGDGKTTLSMAWLSKPKIITQRNLDNEWNNLSHLDKRKYGGHKNTYAIAKGYDALYSNTTNYMVVFNRSKIAVLDD